MSGKTMDVSIIIPTKNGANLLDRVLSAIFAQKTLYTYEVIVVDSGSIDSTLSILKNYPVRLYEIPPEQFSHSRTRNYGASLSLARAYLLFLNQDAVPADEYWLDNLIKSIELEPDVKAVCATELNEKKRYFNVSGVATYVFVNSYVKGLYVIEPYILSQTAELPKWEQRQLFPFTTVCALFEKEHFLLHQFNEKMAWGEDLHWAVDNSNQGYKSACTSIAKVFHFHANSEQEFKSIIEHTTKVYKEIFSWDDLSLARYILTGNPDNVSGDASASIAALRNSWSWRITAPLRKVHSFLLHLSGRSDNDVTNSGDQQNHGITGKDR